MIIGVIALITSPLILNVIGKSEKKAFERSIDGIMEAVRIDVADDDFNVPREYYYEDGVLTLLTVGDTERNEVIETQGKINGAGSITVDIEGNIIITNICNDNWCASNTIDNPEITMHPNDGTGNPVIDPLDPEITLNGSRNMYIGLNEEFTDPGAKAQTHAGDALEYETLIKRGTTIVDRIDTTKLNSYTITYTTTNNGKEVSVVRNVRVVEMKPQITITKADENYKAKKTVVIKVTAVSPNKVDNFTYQVNDGEEIQVNGLTKTIDLNVTGNYTITVKATDDKGHSNEVVGGPYKIDADGPEITFDSNPVNLTTEEVKTYNLLSGVTVTDAVEGNITVNTTNVTTSGTLSATTLGEQKITYTARDTAGNTTTKERTFNISDKEKPKVTFSPNEQSSYASSVTVTINVTDNIGIKSTIYKQIKNGTETTITPTNNKVTFNSTGNYQIKVIATDTSDNTNTVTSGTYNIDTTGPTITVPSSTEVKSNEVTTYDLMTGVTITDAVSGNITARCGEIKKSCVDITGSLTALTSGDLTNNQTIKYKAYDALGNASTETSRTITVVETGAPTLSATPAPTDVWTSSMQVIISAVDDSNLKSFSYEVYKKASGASSYTKDDSGSVTINSSAPKSASKTITLATHGASYYITMTATDIYNNTSTSNTSSGGKYYMTDTEGPGISSESVSSTWSSSSNTVTATITDAQSGVKYYQLKSGSSTTAPTSGWSTISTATSTYNYSASATSNGTWTIWVKDSAGNTNYKAVTVSHVDTTTPSITIKNSPYTATEGTSYATSNFYSATYGGMGGSTTCKVGSTTVTNVSSLAVGSHTLTCTPKGNNGKTGTSKTASITIKSAGKTGIEIMNEAPSTQVASKDPGSNKRYIGSNPNNYVRFNNENWRIIGVFGGQMKIIRNDFYSTSLEWDKNSSNGGHGSYGWNDWSQATLKTELNGTYWNTISSTYQNMVDQDHTWNLGGAGSSTSDWTRQKTYNAERGTTVYSGRPTTWKGAVGLMYASDYGYATSSTSSDCDLTMNTWGATCYANNWFYNSSMTLWTLTPSSGDEYNVLHVDTNGRVDDGRASLTRGVRPVLYLESSVKITGGSGTSSSPYTLGS